MKERWPEMLEYQQKVQAMTDLERARELATRYAETHELMEQQASEIEAALAAARREGAEAALPAEPPSALMSAIHMAIENETGIQINTPISQIIWRMVRAHILGADA